MALVLVEGSSQDENGNKVTAPAGLTKVYVDFSGKNNELIIDMESGVHSTIFSFPADDGICLVGSQGNYSGKVRVGWRCLVSIGSRVTCTTACAIYTAEATSAVIGDDCMIASQVQIRTEDSHAIFDVESGARLNPSRNVVIGQHVWLAESALILSGAVIGSGTTVAARAVVKSKAPNNCVIAGIPSKIIKHNTAWERPNIAFSQPWIRKNAKEQSLVRATQAWKMTDVTMTKVSLGRASLSSLRNNQKIKQGFDLSSFIL